MKKVRKSKEALSISQDLKQYELDPDAMIETFDLTKGLYRR